MTYAQVYPQFNVWYDTDGTPLNNGSIYIGTAGLDPESNPISIYYDTSLTVPASQPLTTTNGYITNGGSPAPIYISPTVTSYSLRSKNTGGTTIFNNLNVETLGINLGYPTAPTGKAYFNASSPSSEQDYIYQNPSGTAYQFYASGALADGEFDDVQGNTGTFSGTTTVGGVSVRDGAILNSGKIAEARLPDTSTKDVDNANTDTDALVVNNSSDLDGPISSDQGQVAAMWVNFNGTGGTATINDSYNVTSVTRDSSGNYTITVANDFPNTNYAISANCSNFGGSGVDVVQTTSKLAGSIEIVTSEFDGNLFNVIDMDDISIVVFTKI